MDVIRDKSFDAERALYELKNTRVENCRFEGPADGESAFKETEGIEAVGCFFDLRYPFWHTVNTLVDRAEMTESCRAAMWYDRDMTVRNSRLHGIKALRECDSCRVENCDIISPEFGWKCRGLEIAGCMLQSEYPFLFSRDLDIRKLEMKGKYSFQYVENMEIRNSVLDTKDAFWHTKNVTVYDSVIRGEYLGWYSENLRLVRCRIIGTQPLCYCTNLVLEDCETEKADLAFENSTVQATVKGNIVSVKNPAGGLIRADGIGEVIIDEYVRGKCEIIQNGR